MTKKYYDLQLGLGAFQISAAKYTILASVS